MESRAYKKALSVLLIAAFIISSAAVIVTEPAKNTASNTTSGKVLSASPSSSPDPVLLTVDVLGTLTGGAPFTPLTDAAVTLQNTHYPSLTYTVTYNSTLSGYVIAGAPSGPLEPGYYWVNASAPGYFTGHLSSPLRFNDTASINEQIILTQVAPLGSGSGTVTVFVNNTKYAPSGLKGAFVQFMETGPVLSQYGEGNQTIYSGYTDSAGKLSLAISDKYNYTVLVSFNNLNSSYYQSQEFFADNYTALSAAQVSSSPSISVSLPTASDVQANVFSYNGMPLTGIRAFMLSYAGTNVPLSQRLIQGSVSSSLVSFFVPVGRYVIAVNATGYATYISNVTVTASDFPGILLPSITLSGKFTSSAPLSVTSVTYSQSSVNWRYLNISFRQTLDAGSPVYGVPFSYVPSARMQFALAFNNGYPSINSTAQIQSFLAELGPEYTTTYNLWSVNSSAYMSNVSAFTFSLSGVFTGSIVANSTFSIYSNDSYSAELSSLPANVSSYSAVFDAAYNTTEMHYYNTILLPPGFELYSNSTTSTGVSVSGHTTVVVFTTIVSTGYATVSMTVKIGQKPVVKAAAVTGKYSYAYTKSGVVEYYIVRAGMPINYTAQGSYDPSGGPLYYSWHWNSTTYSSSYTNTSSTVVSHTYYNYTTPGVFINITLSATTVTGKMSNTTISVRVANDTTLTAVISAVNKTLSNGRIYTGQDVLLTVNGLKSKASISPGDDQGIIISYNFSWGDGIHNYTIVTNTQSNLNASHSYSKAGNYTLNLTVTDEVGFTNTTSITVQVNKTLKPIVSFVVYNKYWKAADGSVQENTTVHFNASATTDPDFNNSVLMFQWNFGDIHNITNATTKGNITYEKYVNLTGAQGGMNVTHIYTAISTTPLTVNLTVVAPNGVKASSTYSLVVTSEPRPDLRVINITFKPKAFTQGSPGRINVTIMNVGNANATSAKVKVYSIAAQSGVKALIGTITVFYNGTNKTPVSVIKPNETVYGYITWTPSTFGNFTIKAETSAALQLLSVDNTGTQPIAVSQSQVAVYALYAGIVIIIVAVIAVIALRRRMPARGRDRGKDQKKGR
ncbi:MAG: PKD domain-containing protein [Thermoplasmata archaeon YP2-bin.285]|uniref:PKD domain-containing protein n=2 Tax=Candidatus Sysuiplasma superficiale TaxID=2823368 RepID=A0A8J7YIF2_9ARCH|nr:PKD domain-containing protein [Candidatus Sysuiplasma superficiale]